MAETWLKDTQKGSGETTIRNCVESLLASQQINLVEKEKIFFVRLTFIGLRKFCYMPGKRRG